MKNCLLLGIICLMFSLNLSAQTSGEITVEKKGMKRVYLQNGKVLEPKQFISTLQSVPESSKKYQAVKIDQIAALTSMAVGTAFIGVGFGYTLKAAQATNDGDLGLSTDYSNKSGAMMLVGAGCYLVSIPFLLMGNSNLKKSINLYNASQTSGRSNDIDIYFGLTGDGVGVQLKF